MMRGLREGNVNVEDRPRPSVDRVSPCIVINTKTEREREGGGGVSPSISFGAFQ